MKKLLTANDLPEGLRAHIVRLHNGNDPDGIIRQEWANLWDSLHTDRTVTPRITDRYMTVCILLRKSRPTEDSAVWRDPKVVVEDIVSFGVARANPCDQVNAKLGKSIAIGRALRYKNLYLEDPYALNDATALYGRLRKRKPGEGTKPFDARNHV